MSVFYNTYKQRNGTAIGTVLALTWRTGSGNSASNYQIPHGYLACDGSSVSAAQYPALFDIIGNDYGGSASYNTSTKTYSGNFNLPDYRGRKLIGHGPVQDQGSTSSTSNAVHSASNITSANYHGGATNITSSSISGAFSLASTTTASGHTGISVQQNTTVSGNIGFTASEPSSFSHGLIQHNHPENAGVGGYKWMQVENKNVNCSRGGGGPSFHEANITNVNTPDYGRAYDTANSREDSSGGTEITLTSGNRAHSHWLSVNEGGASRGSRSSDIKGSTTIEGNSSAWSSNVSQNWAATDYVSVNAITTTINSWTPQNHVSASINTSDSVNLVTPFANSLWVIKAY